MEIVSSYGAEIRKLNKPLCATLDIYRKAVAWLIPVYEEKWETLESQQDKNCRFNLAKHLVHETKKNKGLYSFDSAFPKRATRCSQTMPKECKSSIINYTFCHLYIIISINRYPQIITTFQKVPPHQARRAARMSVASLKV